MVIQKELLIRLNQYAQGIKSIQDAKVWFSSIESNRQLEILRELSNLGLQAGARETDIPEAIINSGLKSTYTPCVLLSRKGMSIQLSKVLGLPTNEYLKSFLLLMALFSIADKRRRNTICKDGCSHWWHNDLLGIQNTEY